MVGTVDVLLGNLEDAVKADNKEAARAGSGRDRQGDRLRRRPSCGRGSTRSTSPWVLDDLTTLVTEIGDKLDVIMVPKVAGRRGHPLRRPAARPARGEGRARQRPILVHAILETARGVANVEEICGASARACRASRSARPTSPPTGG